MELSRVICNKTNLSGRSVDQLLAGDKIRIEIEIDGDDSNLLNTEVPAGKKWETITTVEVVETDL